MIVQAIGLLDDLDKELNTYAMRVREWYGWHFPEMTRIVTDNITYAKTVRRCLFQDRSQWALLPCGIGHCPASGIVMNANKEF
jgi:nucleolar protein 58